MNRHLLKYLLFTAFGLLILSCRQAKYVPSDKYLLKDNEIRYIKKQKKNKIKYTNDNEFLYEGAMEAFIRPVPNRPLKLFFYNRIDTTKHKRQVENRIDKTKQKNAKRKARENKINKKRILKAEAKNKELYKHKVIHLKEPKLGWREFVRESLGQAPILLDTAKVHKSSQQLNLYLKKKGFHYGSVSDTIVYKEKKKKAFVKYTVNPGNPYRINAVRFDSLTDQKKVWAQYKKFVEREESGIVKGALLDQDVLDTERERFASYCRNQAAMFGFNRNYIGFAVDTTVGNMLADVYIYVKPKFTDDPNNPGNDIKLNHEIYRIKDVTFRLHNPDTSSFKDYQAYKEKCECLGFADCYDGDGRFLLLDTLVLVGKGTFIFNETPFLKPELLDKQNFLEIDSTFNPNSSAKRYYKEYYVERSYRTMSNLGVFTTISPTVEVDPENPFGSWVVVSYDLVPVQKQSFLFEPRLANTNSILGIFATASYTNKNLFRGAQQLKVSLIGGGESQPLIVRDEGEQSNPGWRLNTFEWGPKIELTFPKIVPAGKRFQETVNRRAYPKTTMDLALNFQKRIEFDRTFIKLGHEWSFQQSKTQKWNLSLMNAKFVRLNKTQEFQDQLDASGNLDLINSYTDHFSTVMSVGYHLNNSDSDARKKKKNKGKYHLHDLQADIYFSGFLWDKGYDLFTDIGAFVPTTNELDQRLSFGVPYTEFFKFDVRYSNSIYLNKKNKIANRIMIGAVFPFGNSISVPYEQSFIGGGANDIRAFEARTMAPGSTPTYLDSNATSTQIGDMRIEANIEWRFQMTSMLEGAFFVDVGNIWNIAKEGQDPSGFEYFEFANFYKSLAVGPGFGVRADFDFLIVRIDLAFPLHNPHLPVGERWWLSDKTLYNSYFTNPETGELENYESPHLLKFNFGIGYPF